jgi:hypothetical protein
MPADFIHRRKRAVALFLFLLCLLFGTTWWYFKPPVDNESRYRRILSRSDWVAKISIAEFEIPPALSRCIPFDDLKEYLESDIRATVDILVQSGYMTNAILAISGLPPLANRGPITVEVQRMLDKMPPSVPSRWSWGVTGTNLTVTCRTDEIERIKAAISQHQPQ